MQFPSFLISPISAIQNATFLIQALEYVLSDRAEALAAIADMDEEEAREHIAGYQDMLEMQEF